MADSDEDQSGLQLAPDETKGPDFGELKTGFENAVTSISDFVTQRQANYDTRFAIWAGQSSDGKKHTREGSKITPTPWDGASDQQVFLVDEAIIAYVSLLMNAWRKSTLIATPIQGADAARAKIVSQFMKWLVSSQIPHMEREVELLANALYTDGIAATGQFWEVREEKVLKRFAVADFPPELQQALADPEQKDAFVQLAVANWEVTEKRAKKFVADLIKNGEASIGIKGAKVSRPIFRTFTLGDNLFIHGAVTDPENAPAMYRLEYYTPEQLRSFVNTDGWGEDWVHEAIEKLIGKELMLTNKLDLSGLAERTQDGSVNRYDNLIAVVHAYERLSDEDGIPGVYHTVFNPNLPPCDEHDGYAKTGLLGYGHGEYPFVIHRREFLDRRLYSTRGLPEIGKPFQQQVKVCRDSRIDASSLSVMPPLLYPQGRAPTKWGPGVQVPERRPNEYHYADRPTYDVGTTVVEDKQVANWKEYCGFTTAEGDQQTAATKKAVATEKFLGGMVMALRQIFLLWKDFGDEQTWFRVVGSGNTDPQQIQKGEGDENFDFTINYNSLTASDPENFERITTSIAQAVASFDKFGQVDYSELLTMILSSIDTSIADRIITPKAAATEKVVGEIKDTVVRAMAGFDESIKLGTPPDIGLQVIQQFVQNPGVQQKLGSDPEAGKRVEKLWKQFDMQRKQEINKTVGRYGA